MNNGDKTILQLYKEHKGKVSDKWTRYLLEYDLLFDKFRDKPVRMLEIGVQNGGGLEIWAEYFKNGSKFIGCDIDSACAALRFDDPRIEMVIGDANADAIQSEILSHSPVLDIVIDDGSHRSGDIVRSFLKYFPNLVDGGVYVVEDLHASYWKEYEAGLFDPFSSISFFKRLVDIINSEHWGIDRIRTDILSGFREKYGDDIQAEVLEHIHSIKFINSLCIILKSLPKNNQLGERVVAGVTATVYSDIELSSGNSLEPLSQTQNPWSMRIRPPDEEILEREQEVKELTKQIEEKAQALQAMTKQLVDYEHTIQAISFEKARAEAEVLGYALSRSWKITRPLRKIMQKIRTRRGK